MIRPLMARAVSEHEALSAEAGAANYLRHTGWLKLYRSDQSFAGAGALNSSSPQRFGIANVPLDGEAARTLEPSLQAGVPPRRALDPRRERHQSTGADNARLLPRAFSRAFGGASR